jgi:hypothetical protein
MNDMELKGFEEMGESEERSVQGGFWYYGRQYTMYRTPTGQLRRAWW